MVQHPQGGVVIVDDSQQAVYFLPTAAAESWTKLPIELKTSRRYTTVILVPDHLIDCD